MQELDMAKVNNEKVEIDVVEMERDDNPETKTFARGKLRIAGERSLHYFSIIKGKKRYNPFFVMFPFKRFYENDAGYTNTVYDTELIVPDNYGEQTSSSTVWKAIDAALLAAFYDAAFSESQKTTLIEEYKQFRRKKFKRKDDYTPGCDNCLFRETHRPTTKNERGLTEDRQSRHFCALWQKYVDRDVQKYFDDLEKTQNEKQPLIQDGGLDIKGRRVDNLIKDMLNSEGRGCLQHTFKFEKGDGWVVRKPYAEPLIEVLQKFEKVINVGHNVIVDTAGIYDWVENQLNEKNKDDSKSDNELPPFNAEIVESREGLDEESARTIGRRLGLGKGLEGEKLEQWVSEYVELGA